MIDETDEACVAGHRFYYSYESILYAVDTRTSTHCRLVDCGFRPLNVTANHGFVAACGNGDAIVLVDAYTGELLFAKDAVGGALTNTLRIFKVQNISLHFISLM